MKILLLSTLPNKVHSSLSTMPGVELLTIDIANIPSRQDLYNGLRSLLSQDFYDILLTYRCPYIIPEDIFSKFPLRLNIHPLPLPEFAGLNPWESFFSSGHNGSEAVMHILDSLPDSGTIIMKEPYTFHCTEKAREAADTAASIMISRFVLNFHPSQNTDI